MRKLFFYAFIMAMTVVNYTFTACTSDQEGQLNELTSSQNQLKLNVNTSAITASRALIEETYLPDNSEIGVTLLASDGNAYDGKTYSNIKFTADGTTSQTWTGSSNILLSATPGNVYAYYPYSSSVTDITAVPVETGTQTDYMYATEVTGVYDAESEVDITMNHALSAIRFALKKGTYTGTGTVTSVSVTSTATATGATMNSKTGVLSSFSGSGNEISVTKGISLTTSEQNADVIVVPTGTNAALTLKVVIDGKTYSVNTDALTLTKGNIYKYTVTVNATSLELSGVTVGEWGYNESGNPVIDLGYKVTIAGNLNEIALANTINGNTLTIKAVPFTYGKPVKEVSYEGTATVSQTADETTGIRTITVSGIQSNVKVNFDGTGYQLIFAGNQSGINVNKSVASDGTTTITASPTVSGKRVKEVSGSGSATMTQSLNSETGVRTITIKNQTTAYTVTFDGVEDIPVVATAGVYAVSSSGALIDVANADESCIAVALVVGEHKFWIEKNETKNTTSIKAAYTEDGASNTNYTYFYWGMYGSDNTSITNYTQTGGGGTSSYGYLPQANGSYASSSNNLSGDYTTWTSGALSDFNGKANTAALLAASDTDSYTTYANMATWCRIFNQTAAENQGYSDWYIPACGQLSLMYLNMTAINNALTKIGGQTISSLYFWSSSEYSSSHGWGVNFFNGYVSDYDKSNYSRVRFVRDF